MKALLFLLVLASSAMAQRKVWSWIAPDPPGERDATAILTSRTDAKGNTVLVLGETWENPASGLFESQFRLLWITSKGVVLHNQVIPTTRDRQYLLGEAKPEPWMERWDVLAVTARSCAFTDGKALWTGKAKGKLVEVTKSEPAVGLIRATPAGAAGFQGYLQRKGAYSWGYVYEIPPRYGIEANAEQLEELSLWSL